MNIVLALIGAVAAFWISAELVLEWNEPLLGFAFAIMFFVLCLGAILSTKDMGGSSGDAARRIIDRFRGRRR